MRLVAVFFKIEILFLVSVVGIESRSGMEGNSEFYSIPQNSYYKIYIIFILNILILILFI